MMFENPVDNGANPGRRENIAGKRISFASPPPYKARRGVTKVQTHYKIMGHKK